jgi:transcriptional regulator NrdR family protein
MLINEPKYFQEDDMICPYCDHPQEEPWDYRRKDSGKTECESCAKKFKYVRDTKISYSTWELE